MKVINPRTQQTIVESVTAADTFLKRMLGLLFSKELRRGCGLWLRPCNGIHTFGMRFPIDAVYLDKQNQVVKIIQNLKPNRVGPIMKQAVSVLELPADYLDTVDLRLNDVLDVVG